MKKQWTFLLVCTLLIIAMVLGARRVETDFGRVNVSIIHFPDPSGITLVAKLYVPDTASVNNKLPAVLALHGFQNDKDTQDAFSIELARRGFVVLALDQFGHGDTGGTMNQGDKTLGGNAAYLYMKALPYVDSGNLGIMGHSMGAGSAIAVAEANPDHRAVNPQCGSAGTPALHNVLLTQAKYDEFIGFRENQTTTANLTTNPDRLAEFGLPAPVKWDTLYGDFATGTARMQTLIPTVHPGVTHNSKAVAQTVLWMDQALKGGVKDSSWIDPSSQIFMWKEVFTLLALLIALISLIPLCNLLLSIRFFAPVAQPVPGRYTASTGNWIRSAVVNNLIAGLSFPIFTTIAGYLLMTLVPGLSMIIGNGVAVWFLLNALIYFFIFSSWYRKARQTGVTMYDMGVSFDEGRTVLRWDILGKTALVGFLLLGWLYLLVTISQVTTGVEFRFLWPFLRDFSPVRFGYFCIYIIPAVIFFILNGGIFLFGQNAQKQAGSPARTQLIWWLKNCAAAISGLLLIWLFQYIPFLLGFAPGFELIHLTLLSGMIPLLLFVYIPEFIVLFFFLTWFYRRTGRVYLGALVIASLAIWFLAAGTAM